MREREESYPQMHRRKGTNEEIITGAIYFALRAHFSFSELVPGLMVCSRAQMKVDKCFFDDVEGGRMSVVLDPRVWEFGEDWSR